MCCKYEKKRGGHSPPKPGCDKDERRCPLGFRYREEQCLSDESGLDEEYCSMRHVDSDDVKRGGHTPPNLSCEENKRLCPRDFGFREDQFPSDESGLDDEYWEEEELAWNEWMRTQKPPAFPWTKEGMFQKGEWLPFLSPEDMPSLCAIDKAGYVCGVEILRRLDKLGYEFLERGKQEGDQKPREKTAENSGHNEEDKKGNGKGAKAQNDANKVDFALAVKWWEEHANLLANPDSAVEDLRCSLQECLELLSEEVPSEARERLQKRVIIVEGQLRTSLENKRKRDDFLETTRKNV